MIVNGIKVARIRIPKALRDRYVRHWDWIEIADATTARGKLARKLALAAAQRWSLAPSAHYDRVMSGDVVMLEATREQAVRAVQCLVNNYPVELPPGLSRDELIGWAEIEMRFQERLPQMADEIALAKQEWTR